MTDGKPYDPRVEPEPRGEGGTRGKAYVGMNAPGDMVQDAAQEAVQDMAQDTAERVVVSVEFTPRAFELLANMARRQDITEEEVIRRALGLQRLVLNELAEGGKVLIERAGRMRRVILP